MLQPKEKFLDRVEQTFVLFKNNISGFTLPLLIFNLITLVLIPYIVGTIALRIIPLEEIFSGNATGALSNVSFIISLLVTTALFLTLVYILILIPVQVGTIRSVKQGIQGDVVTPKENFLYGCRKIFDAFRTYWYIFAYVLLLPALIFIVGGILLNIGLYYNTSSTEIFTIIGGILMGAGVIAAVFYSIYRGVKATFAMVSAVDSEKFTKENFLSAVSMTDNKWKRIFGNTLGFSLLGMLVIGLIGGIGESIAFFGSDFDSISQLDNDREELLYLLESIKEFNIFYFINSLLQTFLNTLFGVVVTVFTYILFKRLEVESQKGNDDRGETVEL